MIKKVLLLSSFFLFGGTCLAEYSIITHQYSPYEGCIFFEIDIWHEGGDGVRGGNDDIHWASGIIRGNGCNQGIPNPPHNDFEPTTDFIGTITEISPVGSCTNYNIEVFDLAGEAVGATGVIEYCGTEKSASANHRIKPLQKHRPVYELDIYPTIATNELNIVDPPSYTSIQIFNLQGALVRQLNTEDMPSSINVSNLPNGIYIIKAIDTYRRNYSSKFTINH